MKIGFVGWRGMVGSVLRSRMEAEGDFEMVQTTFFSTSNAGGVAPNVAGGHETLADAADLHALAAQDVVLTCQGSSFTREAHPALRKRGWTGIWIDASSALRMHEESTMVLDPVNGAAIRQALHTGCKTFVGANCTVSLMLMALNGLIRSGHVRTVTTMTYQAASGAGAANLRELVAQMRFIGDAAAPLLDDSHSTALALDHAVAAAMRDPSFPTASFGAPLAASALPWIDRLVDGGQTREEWKGMAEANKLLDLYEPLIVDGICVRIGALRCHAQALSIELDEPLSLEEIAGLLTRVNPWVDLVPNTQEATLAGLTPAAIAGSLRIAVGRLRHTALGPRHVSCFTVGDQLLWGAAEPLRRMVRILVEDQATTQ
jgi:aspartate-semialdehyde dehydrogenase